MNDLGSTRDGYILTQVGPDVWTPLVYVRRGRNVFEWFIRPVCEDCP